MMQKIGDAIATEGRAKYNDYSKYNDRDIYKGLTFWSPDVLETARKAVADILFGNCSSSGKLPVTFCKAAGSRTKIALNRIDSQQDSVLPAVYFPCHLLYRQL